jgi:hypothetical protein
MANCASIGQRLLTPQPIPRQALPAPISSNMATLPGAVGATELSPERLDTMDKSGAKGVGARLRRALPDPTSQPTKLCSLSLVQALLCKVPRPFCRSSRVLFTRRIGRERGQIGFSLSTKVEPPMTARNIAELLRDLGVVLRWRMFRAAGTDRAPLLPQSLDWESQLALRFVSLRASVQLRAMVEDWPLPRIQEAVQAQRL